MADRSMTRRYGPRRLAQARDFDAKQGVMTHPAAQHSIFLATPCYGGLATIAYMSSVLALQRACMERKIGLQVELGGGDALIPRAVGDWRSWVRATRAVDGDRSSGSPGRSRGGTLALRAEREGDQ
jgi:hypothetical protein